jgi:methylenetetrahydrofolate reductase (NADPH)
MAGQRAEGAKPNGMRIDFLLKSAWPAFSFEFMAPRSPSECESLFFAASELLELRPAFVCITCRAGRHADTIDLAVRMRRDLGAEVMTHIVCDGLTKGDVAAMLAGMRRDEISNILALRGDLDASRCRSKGDFEHASDLATFVAQDGSFCVGAACYPEGHVESTSRAADLAFTKRKIDAGASFLITQLFFDNSHYFDFVGEARAGGIEVPILPGILPITNAKQLPRIKAMGVSVPERLEREILLRADDPQAVAQFGVAWASLQCTSLLAAGAPGVHFYTFNRSPATRAILGALRSAQPWKWRAKDSIA